MYSWHHEIIESDLFIIFNRMTREEKISAIYKEMANKELTPWCCVEVKAQNEYGDFTYRLSRWDERPTSEIKEIIGHPVMIGDVLRQIRLLAGYALDNDLIKKSDFGNVIAHHNYRITQIWEDFREPIEDQSDECIDFIYSLIKK